MPATQTPAAANFLDTLHALRTANDATLTHMVIVHPEGSVPGDAAFAALAARHGMRGAQAIVDAEQAERELDIWGQRMEVIGKAAMQAAA